jgi:hypothetical protein
MNPAAFLLLMEFPIWFGGCAAIFGGGSNTMVFMSADAMHVQVYLNGNYIGDAPGNIKKEKKKIQQFLIQRKPSITQVG